MLTRPGAYTALAMDDDSLRTSEASEGPRGADAAATTRARLDAIAARLPQLADLFAQNVAAATQDWSKHIPDEAALQSMPTHDKQRASARARAQQLEGFLLTLDEPSYQAALHQIDDRKLRRDLYEAYVTRASDHGPRAGRFDNIPLVQEILSLRHEQSLLLGRANFAELALSGSGLRSQDDVERFLLRGSFRHARDICARPRKRRQHAPRALRRADSQPRRPRRPRGGAGARARAVRPALASRLRPRWPGYPIASTRAGHVGSGAARGLRAAATLLERTANTCTSLFVEDRAARAWELTWAKQMAVELFTAFRVSGFAQDAAHRLRDTFWAAGDRDVLDRLTDALGRAPIFLR